MSYKYEDKLFLISGAAGGIGTAMCQYIAVRGGKILALDKDKRALMKLAENLNSPAHRFYDLDLTDKNQVKKIVSELENDFSHIDVIINNVGMTSAQRFDERSFESVELELGVNLISPLFLTHQVLPLLKKSAEPFLITTVSLGGIFPLGETPIYTTTKFALRGWMLSLAMDFKDKGIKVGSIMPSATDTNMLRQEALDGGNSLQFLDPPQKPADVVKAMAKLLDNPRYEVYPKPSESWLVRVAMLSPGLIPKLLPLFKGRGERGMKKYINSLVASGIVEIDNEGKYKLIRE